MSYAEALKDPDPNVSGGAKTVLESDRPQEQSPQPESSPSTANKTEQPEHFWEDPNNPIYDNARSRGEIGIALLKAQYPERLKARGIDTPRALDQYKILNDLELEEFETTWAKIAGQKKNLAK